MRSATPFDCLWARGFRYYFTPLPGCFSPFPHGTGSLSVARECLALGGGPPRFARDFTCPALLGIPTRRPMAFAYRAITFYGCPFQGPSANRRFSYCVMGPPPHPVGPTTPARKRRWAITPCGFRLVPVRSPLLRESRLLSSPRPTEMFQFERFPPQVLCIQTWVTGHDPGRVTPFGYPRIDASLAAPRGFSQPRASFIGSWRQGIHRKPLLT